MTQPTPRKNFFSAYICLGSNMGDAPAQLAEAIHWLEKYPNARIGAVSSVYLTEPQGQKDQPWFHNQIARLDIARSENDSPEQAAILLLNYLLEKELIMGRMRDVAHRFGPRVIDMDLLFFDSITLHTSRLTLPHPRMHERAFVLIPLKEIAPELLIPEKGSIEKTLSLLKYQVEGNKIFQ